MGGGQDPPDPPPPLGSATDVAYLQKYIQPEIISSRMWNFQILEISGAVMWLYATNYLNKRAQEEWNKGPVICFEGWACYNAVAFWLITNQRKH